LIFQKSCRSVYAAKLFPDLRGINTSAAEQLWSWFNRLAGMMKYMNQHHYALCVHVAKSVHNSFVLKKNIFPECQLEGYSLDVGELVDAYFTDTKRWYCGCIEKIVKQRVIILFVGEEREKRTLGMKMMRRCKHKPQTNIGSIE
jgi:hypothetical protein